MMAEDYEGKISDSVMMINLTKDDLQLLIEGKTIGFYDGKIRIVVK